MSSFDESTWQRAGAAAVISLGLALLSIPVFIHNDDGDSMIYRVVARHMVEDGTWTDLRYLTNVFPVFREHLPFGFWPYAATIRLFGEGALPFAGLAFALGTLLTTLYIGWKRLGPWAGVVATLILAVTESFWADGGRARLDPPLVLLANLAAAPVLLGRRDARGWLWALLFGTLAALVKGPFGLVPLAAASAASAAVERKWSTLFLGGAVCFLAALPAAGFLLHDRYWGGGTWWDGYVRHQLLASAVGARSDGTFAWWFPARNLAMRFWPGFAALALAAFFALAPHLARRRIALNDVQLRDVRTFALHSLLMLVILTLPTRKHWFHALVAFPGWALCAGAGLAPVLAQLAPRWKHRLVATAGVVASALFIGSAFGATAFLTKKPFPFCTDFGPFFAAQPPRTRVLIAGPLPWHPSSSLAAEFKLDPIVELTDTRSGAAAFLRSAEHHSTRYALVHDQVLPELEGWQVRQRAREWNLLERR